MRIWGSCTALGALLAASILAAPAEAAVIFEDNFDAGASAAWGNQRGNWRDGGGVYDATNPSNNPTTYSDVTTLTDLTDFTVEVDVNDLNDGGIWLRSSFSGGSASGVLLVTGGSLGSFNGFYWHTVQNDVFSGLINPQGFDGAQGSDVHLRVTVVGNLYSLFVNGSDTALTTLTTSLFTSGSVGLYDFSPISGASDPRGQTFDNFVVSVRDPVPGVPEPASLALVAAGLAGAAFLRRRRKAA